jgi:hypothetical protein
MAFIGQTRSRKLIARLAALGLGEMTQADEYPPRRRPYILDNTAFKAWKAGRPLDAEAFRVALDACKVDPPAFVVVPDRVAGGVESLRLSLSWVDECKAAGPAYLVVQDGMHLRQVARVLHRFDGVFVGGTLGWKLKTSEAWVRLAHAQGKPCHIGRVGTPKRVRWAQRIGADSIDSSLPLWSEGQLTRFIGSLGRSLQADLFTEAA